MAGMTAEEKEILKRTRLDIIESLDVKDIIDHLQADGIINIDKKDEIFACGTRRHQCGQFLDILVRSGPVAYTSFKKALGIHYDFLRDAIHKVEEEVKFLGLCEVEDYEYILAGGMCKQVVRTSMFVTNNTDDDEEIGYLSLDTTGGWRRGPPDVDDTHKPDDNDIYIVTENTEGKQFDPYMNENEIYLTPSAINLRENSIDGAGETNESHETEDETKEKPPDKMVAFDKNDYVIVRKSENPDITAKNTSVSDESEPLMVFVYNKYGRKARLPLNVLKKYGDPRGEPWFYPIPLSSYQAALFLSSTKQKGCFLVYESFKASDRLPYNLSVCQSDDEEDVVHYRIKRHADGKVLSIETAHNSLQTFPTIHELVAFYQKNKSALATRLRRPLQFATSPLADCFNVRNSDWEIDNSMLDLNDVCIGKGYFGVVKSGSYDGCPVAVKSLLADPSSVPMQDDFYNEAELLAQLSSHDNIVKLIGTRFTDKPFYIITELIGKGSLKTCLRQKLIDVENEDLLYELCLQVVSAMVYLESRRFILHRDIAARNCLLTADDVVKLSDFGMARHVLTDIYEAPGDEKVAIQWAAPEVLSNQIYSTKSDVWATAVVFWEIYSGGKKPYGDTNRHETAKNVTSGLTLPKPSESCSGKMFQIMQACWSIDREKRPSFANIHEQFVSKNLLYYDPYQASLPKGHMEQQHSTQNRANIKSVPQPPGPLPARSYQNRPSPPQIISKPPTKDKALASIKNIPPPPLPSRPERKVEFRPRPPTPPSSYLRASTESRANTKTDEEQSDSKTTEAEQENEPTTVQSQLEAGFQETPTQSSATKKKSKYTIFAKKRDTSKTSPNDEKENDKVNAQGKDHKSNFYTSVE